MSLAGGALQSGGPSRTASQLSTPAAAVGAQQPMRRGFSRLGLIADGGSQLLQQRCPGGFFQALGLLGNSSRHRLLSALLPPRAASRPSRSGQGRQPSAAQAGTGSGPVDKAHVNYLRASGESQRLNKDYDNVSPRKAEMALAKAVEAEERQQQQQLQQYPHHQQAFVRELPPRSQLREPPLVLYGGQQQPQLQHYPEPPRLPQQAASQHAATSHAHAASADQYAEHQQQHPAASHQWEEGLSLQQQEPQQQQERPQHMYQADQQQHEAGRQQRHDHQPSQSQALPEAFEALLYEGHPRSPEQTLWAEASTSGSSGGGGGGGVDASGDGGSSEGKALLILGQRQRPARRMVEAYEEMWQAWRRAAATSHPSPSPPLPGTRNETHAVSLAPAQRTAASAETATQPPGGWPAYGPPYGGAADAVVAVPAQEPSGAGNGVGAAAGAGGWQQQQHVMPAHEAAVQQQEAQQLQLQQEEASAAASAAASPPKKKRRTKKVLSEEEASAAAAAEGIPGGEGGAAAAMAAPAPAKRKAASRKTKVVDVDGEVRAGDANASGTAAIAVAAAKVAAAPPPPPSYLDEGLLPLFPPEPLADGSGYFRVAAGREFATRHPLQATLPPDVLIVDTPEVARAVVAKLLAQASVPYPGSAGRENPAVGCRYFACDTEVAFIDVTTQTPIGHGAVLCFSIYGGDDLDFSDCARAAGAGAGTAGGSVAQDRIWVDVWPEVELNEAGEPIMEGRYVRLKPQHPVLAEFKRFFEDETAKKVWHNYGFDRHVLENMGVECRGFGGDTLHMARLADASRSGKKTYGLDSLTSDKDIMRFFKPYNADKPARARTGDRRAARSPALAQGGPPGLMAARQQAAAAGGGGGRVGTSPGAIAEAKLRDMMRAKVGMKELFGMYKIRGDGLAKVAELPPIHLLHTRPLFRPTWVDYSALDAKATWQLREALEAQLRGERWEMEASLAKQLGYDAALAPQLGEGQPPAAGVGFLHLWHFYCAYWLDFGELLTEMERRGMMVNRDHLAKAEVKAKADRDAAEKEFLDWADSKVEGARYMNPGSGSQIRMLLFPDHPGYSTKAAASEAGKARAAAARAAKSGPVKGGSGDAGGGEPEAVGGAEAGVRKVKVVDPEYEAKKAAGEKATRHKTIELHGIWGRGVPGRLVPEKVTATDAAAVSILVLRGLAGKPGAARKELTKLLEARAAAATDVETRAAAAAAAAAAARTAVPIVADEEDVALESVQGEAGGNESNGAGEEEEAIDTEAEAAPDGRLFGCVPVVDDPAALEALEREAKDKGLGKLFAACGGGEEGLRACVAVEALCEVNAIDKLLSAFIIPLQGDAISTTTRKPLPPALAPAAIEGAGAAAEPGGSDGTAVADGAAPPSSSSSSPSSPSSPSPGQTRLVHRVHCSLNINTETGRLSARRPNLQNQPALEKDRYQVRRAFTADVAAGKTLVVADYGQLELRLLAHMTDCESMRTAFVLGGDFHSRTAVGMYDYIKQEIADGNCLLEWEGSGEPDKPLVKDKYAAERRKAKVLNFSIAYGKTAHGLAADFKTSREEAQATVDKWYSDRFEVRNWQEATKASARQEGKVRTLLGRTRPLPNINSNEFKLMGHSERAAINTPIQGSAADVAAAAMVAIAKSQELKDTGFELLMQIHDEVILEGPKEHAAAAKRLVMSLMANPWAELAKHWNAAGAAAAGEARGSLAQGPGWRRLTELPGGHVAGVWRFGEGKEGEGELVMPLLVELATDCNVADTWYEAK